MGEDCARMFSDTLAEGKLTNITPGWSTVGQAVEDIELQPCLGKVRESHEGEDGEHVVGSHWKQAHLRRLVADER
jgi:hypothetical protein